MEITGLLFVLMGSIFFDFAYGEFRDHKTVMVVIDNEGDLSMFWIAHKDEEQGAKVSSSLRDCRPSHQ